LLKLLHFQCLSVAHDAVESSYSRCYIVLVLVHAAYSLPVWCGFLTVDLKFLTVALLKRLFRYGYLTK